AGITDLNDSHLYNVVHTVNPAFMNELEMPYLYTLTFGLLPEVRDYRFFASGGITQMMIYIMESLNGERPLVFGGDIAYQYPNIEQGRGGNGGLQFVSRGLGVTSQASQKIVLHHNCMLI
ncbi:hypothetical protein KC660_03365, partial [Candidatus Dojkabacteria bacterium]|nr:hypothetical protein [Candidatus Dojkabacteria bacterium]